MNIKIMIITAFLSLLSACSLIPNELKTPENVVLVPYQAVKNSPEAHQSKMARWGGVIAEVKNLADSTMVEVVNVDLTSSSAKPRNINESAGRFRAIVKGFLDPMIYQQGKKVTFVGTVAASQTDKIGELEYVFPVLIASGVYLWKDVEPSDTSLHAEFFMGRYYDPFYRYPFPYLYPRHTVIIKKTAPTQQTK